MGNLYRGPNPTIFKCCCCYKFLQNYLFLTVNYSKLRISKNKISISLIFEESLAFRIILNHLHGPILRGAMTSNVNMFLHTSETEIPGYGILDHIYMDHIKVEEKIDSCWKSLYSYNSVIFQARNLKLFIVVDMDNV